MTDWILSGGLLPAALLVLWTPMAVAAMRQRRLTAWWLELPGAMAVGGVVGLVAFALVVLGPTGGAEGSAWLARICGSFAVVATAFAWPVLALRRARRLSAAGWGMPGAALRPVEADRG